MENLEKISEDGEFAEGINKQSLSEDEYDGFRLVEEGTYLGPTGVKYWM